MAVAREHMKRGDALFQQGDVVGAVEQHLLACDASDASVMQRTALRGCIVRLDPARVDVRRLLVEDYITLGLMDDADKELARVVTELETIGDRVGHAAARSWHIELFGDKT
ncbi:hypothetical protein BH09MYX1_BH09MYX1_21190 [soil metagenome]